MKKSLLLVAAMALFTTQLQAQCKGLVLATEAGISRSSLRGFEKAPNMDYDPAYNFSGGVSVKYNFQCGFFIKTAALFDRKGMVVSGKGFFPSGEEVTFTQKEDYDYLTVPLLFGAGFGKRLRIFANAGGYASYLMQKSSLVKATDFKNRGYETAGLNNKMDYGFSVGAGSKFRVKRVTFSIELRNNRGLTNISKVPVNGQGFNKTNASYLLLGAAVKI